MKHILASTLLALLGLATMLFSTGCPPPPPPGEIAFPCNLDVPIHSADSSLIELIVLMNPELEGQDLFGPLDTLYKCALEVDTVGNPLYGPWQDNFDGECLLAAFVDTLFIGQPVIFDEILTGVNEFFFGDSSKYYFEDIFLKDSCECAEDIYLMRALLPTGVDINNGISRGASKTRENGGGAVYAAGFNYSIALQPVNDPRLVDSIASISFDTICPETKGGNRRSSPNAQTCRQVNFYPRPSLPTNTTKVAIVDTGTDPAYNYSGQYGPQAINDYFVLTEEMLFMTDPASVRTPTPYGEQWSGDGTDQNLNCFVNDYYGYDFFHADNNPADKKGHGTHLAYTVLTANQDTSRRVRVMPLQFGGFPTGSNDFECDLFAGICAINYAVEQRTDVLNLSWGYYSDIFHDVLYDQLLKSERADMLVVASVGNDFVNIDSCWHWPSGFNQDPVLSNTVLAVAALDSFSNGNNYRLASYSNYGNQVDIAAPGTQIVGALAGSGMGTIPLDGTSMATAVVSRRAAILHRPVGGAVLSARQLKAALLSETVPLATLPAIPIQALDHTADNTLLPAIGY